MTTSQVVISGALTGAILKVIQDSLPYIIRDSLAGARVADLSFDLAETLVPVVLRTLGFDPDGNPTPD